MSPAATRQIIAQAIAAGGLMVLDVGIGRRFTQTNEAELQVLLKEAKLSGSLERAVKNDVAVQKFFVSQGKEELNTAYNEYLLGVKTGRLKRTIPKGVGICLRSSYKNKIMAEQTNVEPGKYSKQFPEIRSIFGGYFHEDMFDGYEWNDNKPDYQAVVRYMKSIQPEDYLSAKLNHYALEVHRL
jgi:hypothetical protein